ncbi:MAG TPA: amino acid adenylation domain-containing protein [Acidimicrobiales bacterium]|nr:amino acid adenylation domain-containing protein [Acidimicrobiales bacterium]
MGPDLVGFEISTQQAAVLRGSLEGHHPLNQISETFAALPSTVTISEGLARAVQRHEILRTTFVQPLGVNVPLQVVNPEMIAPVVESEEALGAETIAGAADAEWGQLLDPQNGPVIRARILRDHAGGGTVILTALAAVADVTSLRMLMAELVPGIGADENGPEEKSLQYADYAAWQREQRQLPGDGPDIWESLDLQSIPLSALPPSASPGPDGSMPLRPRATELLWAGGLATSLDGSAEAIDADPLDVWLASWAVLVGRLTGADNVVLGLATDGRDDDELAGALGPYSRTLPIRLTIDAASTLRSLAGEVRRLRPQIVAAAETVPSTTADSSVPPLSLGLVWRSGPTGTAIPPDAGDYQLMLAVGEAGDGSTTATLWADTASVSERHAEQVGRTLGLLMAGLARNPDEPVREVAALDDIDASWLTSLHGPVTEVEGLSVPLRFEQQVQRHPDRPAVASGGVVLTYGELDRRANGLAALLVTHGVSQAAPVAIVMNRSIDQVVAILAVWKAGAPHLCVNPDQPGNRISAQLQHAGATVVLTAGTAADVMPPFAGTIVRVDQVEDASAVGPELTIGPDDLAYVIYTSGSTGAPKGVAITHASLANYVGFIEKLLEDVPGASSGLTFALVTSLSTDLGNTCLYPALVSGGCVSLVPLDVAMDPELFGSYNASHPADVLKITPSHLGMLLSAGSSILPKQVLVTGGEAVTWELLDRVRVLGDCRLINHYGPSETTVGSLVYEVASAPPHHRTRTIVPIGNPIANTEVYIVDERLRLVAPGAVGELMIGGSGLARGYWGDEIRTAESFSDDPFSGRTGSRLYRTGDQARRLPDGTVEFLGRIDGQVKVRGYRVETGEIEETLARHREVQRAAVVLREDSPGEQRLVAYFVSPYSPGPSPSSLRDYLRDQLPEYMVPAAYVELDNLPLTANGKLDRSALPKPVGDNYDLHREYVPPSSDTEEVIAEVFEELLGLDQVGADDDFFTLGGHSLLATQAIARLRNAFGLELEVHLLFTEPTVAALARAVDERREPDEDAELAALLAEIDSLSDEEAKALLDAESEQDPHA